VTEQRLLKDSVDLPAVKRISEAFINIDPSFKRDEFERASMNGLASLELKQRIDHIVHALTRVLDPNFKKTAKLLQQLPSVWDHGDGSDSNAAYAAWPVIDYVAHAGIEQPKLALSCLEALTGLFSAEFAIRPFIERYPAQCFDTFEHWLKHDDEHVRRLVSEGTRPRLPWGKQLTEFIADPSPIVSLLDALKADPSLYVRRSVANNLNDIAKDHPEIAIEICQRWQREPQKKEPQLEHQNRIAWVIKHATRTLVKQGHPASFALLGYTHEPKIRAIGMHLSRLAIVLGEAMRFSIELQCMKPNQRIVVDYAVHFVKANGRLAKKVFKLKNCSLGLNERVTLEKSISFKPISTRKYYPGEHVIAVHINGKEYARHSFMVEPK